MLFMTPMKPANNLASSRAASFFSVFFLLLFSTPEAAILPRSARLAPGTRRAGRGAALSRHAAACVHQTAEAGERLAVPPRLRTRRRQRSHCGRQDQPPRSEDRWKARQWRGRVPSRTGARRRGLRTWPGGAGPGSARQRRAPLGAAAGPLPDVRSGRRLFAFPAGLKWRLPFPLPKKGFTNLGITG